MNSVFTDVVRCLVAGPSGQDGARTAAFVFPEDFSGFAGHFPGNPVVPGIAQIFAVMVTAGDDKILGGVTRCKFTRPVLPGERMVVAVRGTWDEGVLRCKAEITAEGETCASVSLSVVPRGEN